MRSESLLILILILGAPLNHAGRNSTGIWGVNRQGCRFSRPAPWMARGGAPPNHWRITGTPSLSEVPSGGARAFCLLLRFSKVSRRQGGTPSGRYRSNGYVHSPTVLTVRPPSRASPLPHLDGGVSGRSVSAVRPPSQASQLPHWPHSAYRGDSFTLQAAMPWIRNPQRGKCTCTVPPRSSVRRRISSSRPANSNSPATGSTP